MMSIRTQTHALNSALAKTAPIMLVFTEPCFAALIRVFWVVVFLLSLGSSAVQAGVVFTGLHSFAFSPDGATPYAGLLQGSDGNLYGTTASGGANSAGTVFKMNTNGELNTLYSFTGGTDGANPFDRLVQGSDGSLYGTTESGGANSAGTVFKISTNGELKSLYSFTGGTDGANPFAGLVQGSDGNLYGTTIFGGGTNNAGTVFKINTNGELKSLYSFSGGTDSRSPAAGLVLGSDGNLYGTTYGSSGNLNYGTVFKMSTNGVLTSLYSFTGGTNGNIPYADLTQGSNGNLYGTTYGSVGGPDYGTVFQISSNGVFANLYSFTGGTDGGNPHGGLVQGSDGNLYGTTACGGMMAQGVGYGSVFRVTVVWAPPVFQAVTLTNGAINLTWSTEAGGMYQLQYSSNTNSSGWKNVDRVVNATGATVNLTNGWTNLGGVVNATGATVNATDSVANGPQRFYRVVCLP